MGLLAIIVVLFVLILVLKAKAGSDKVKTESVEFDTQKTVDEITHVLRSLNCNMKRISSDDPLDNGPGPAIAVVCYDEPSFTEKFKHAGGATSLWGVQVFVTDLGNRRHVVLVALGQNLMGNTTDNKGFGMGFSKEYRDKIAQMIS